jgi:LysR family hydrogen peroxide-inducible transcriptional activator
LGHGHKFGTTVKNLAALAKATTSDEYEGTSLDAIRQMAAMGGGVAILPSLYAISEAKRDPQLIVRPIHHPLARRDIALIWRHSSPLAKKFEKVGEVFVDVARDIMV